jgi:hypothetical protein
MTQTTVGPANPAPARCRICTRRLGKRRGDTKDTCEMCNALNRAQAKVRGEVAR